MRYVGDVGDVGDVSSVSGMRMMTLRHGLLRVLLLFGMLLLTSIAAASDRSLRIVELRFSLAAPVLETLRPHLPAGVGASAVDNKLLLNLTDAEWAQLQNLIGQLDKPPARLIVSVRWRQHSAGTSEQTTGELTVEQDRTELAASTAWQTSRAEDSTVQQVSTLSGQAAFLHTGTDIPELTVQLDGRGQLLVGQHYRESGRGFYVLPTLQGDRQVLVRINPRERVPVTGSDGNLHISVLETEVHGPLGQWLPLAGTYQAGETRWQTHRDGWQIQLRVDRLP